MRSIGCRALLAALLFALAGCASSPDGAALPAGPVASIAPATFAGTLPCADCDGTAWTLTVLDDGSYRLRRTRIDPPRRDETHIDLGRWDEDAAMSRITLDGAGDSPLYLQVQGRDALRVLTVEREPDSSHRDHQLLRQPVVDRIDDAFPMRGEFSYMADAGRFQECRSGQTLFVAHEADNAALERAYLQSGTAPGAPVLVEFRGRFAMRPPMEGDGLEEVVIVESFDDVIPGRRCEGSVAAPLDGTHWRLTALPGQRLRIDPSLRAHVRFEGTRISGSGGCNRIIGSFAADEAAIDFWDLAGTRMACPERVMELERRFLTALDIANGYTIESGRLELTGPDGPVARFERYVE